MDELWLRVVRDRLGALDRDKLRASHSSHHCWMIDVGGTSVFAKETGSEGLTSESASFRRASGRDVYGDELWVHEQLFGGADAGVPHVPRYLGKVTTDAGRDFLLLEWVPGRLLWDFEYGADQWLMSARAVAQLNGLLTRMLRGLDSAPCAVMGTPQLFDSLCDEVQGRHRLASPEIRYVLRDHEQLIRDSVDELSRSPMGAVHGQIYPVNIIIDEGPPERVLIVDWETLSNGPAMFDLASLLFGCPWTHEGREKIIDSYFAAVGVETSFEVRRTLRQTELFHQLWILTSVPATYWHTERRPDKGAARRDATLLMLEQCLESLASS